MAQRSLIRTSLLLLAINISQPARAKEDIAAAGLGASTCTEFANFYRADAVTTEQTYFSWAQGFFSGYNFVQGAIHKPIQNLASVDYERQKAIIRRYCDQHPLALYLDAVLELLNEFQTKAGH